MCRTSEKTSCQLEKLQGHSETDYNTAMAQVNFAARGNKKHTTEAKQQKKTSSKPSKHPNKTDVKCKYYGGKHVRGRHKVAAYVTGEIIFPRYLRVPVRMSVNLKLMIAVILNHATLSRHGNTWQMMV